MAVHVLRLLWFTCALRASSLNLGAAAGSEKDLQDGRAFVYLRNEGVSDPAEGFSGRFPEPLDAPPPDGGPNARVLFLGDRFQGVSGLDDVLLKVKLFLTLSRSLRAVPVIGPPSGLLKAGPAACVHKPIEVAAPWWDTYVDTSPQLRRREEARCASEPVVLHSASFFGEAPPEVLAAMGDASKPLCLQLDFLMHFLRPEFNGGHNLLEYELLVKPAWGRVQIWRSATSMALWDRARSTLKGAYNTAHIRRADLAATCTSPARVLQRMLWLDRTGLWFIMSNAEEEWLAEFKSLAQAVGLNYVTEHDVSALAGVQDTYLRYSVLQCLFSGGERRIHTHRSMYEMCHRPGPRHPDVNAEEVRLCRVTGPSYHPTLVEVEL